jgi:hypothetical protein
VSDYDIPFARYVAGGEPEALWPIYRDGRMQHGVIAGLDGSRQTEIAETIAAGIMQLLDTVDVWFVDPQEGLSSNFLWNKASRVFGAGRIPDITAELADFGYQNKTRTWGACFTPSRHRRAIYLIIAMADQVFQEEMTRTFGLLIRICAGAGVGVLALTPDVSLGSFRNDPVRSTLLGGNVLVMRQPSPSAQGLATAVAGGWPEPHRLGELKPGEGYLITQGRVKGLVDYHT